MSEIFEALRKAQRQADARRAHQQPGGDAVVSRPQQTAEQPSEAARPITPLINRTTDPPAPRHRPRRWLPRWFRQTSSNGKLDVSFPLLVSPRHDTTVGEQFRVLRTRIESVGHGTFMVTSALDQEGKTLCAANLAVALSMSLGPGVILVDADLRSPSIASGFGLQDTPGLVDYLRGDAQWEQCLRSTAHERLQVLPAGHSSAMSTELLTSDRMPALLVELKSRFPDRYLLIDAPPLLLTADPILLARHAEHVLLVVRADVTPRDAVIKAIEALGAERFLGVIFNGATESVSNYYYYGRDRYGGHGASST